jgi:hypothetical protein
MNDQKEALSKTMTETLVLSEAYRLRLVGRLWWANLMLVVLPAVFTAAAAIFAAGLDQQLKVSQYGIAAWLAGAAAVLMAVHKSLKCEEYQLECLRLSQGYKSIAMSLGAMLSSPENHDNLQELQKKLEQLTESAKAPLPNIYLTKAEGLVRGNQ